MLRRLIVLPDFFGSIVPIRLRVDVLIDALIAALILPR
jgi:hypothetical protein